MRNDRRGFRSVAVLLLLLSAASCGGDHSAEQEGALDDSLRSGQDTAQRNQIAMDDSPFAGLDDPPGALQCTPPGKNESGTSQTVGSQAGAIVNNPSSTGAVRASKIAYGQQNGAQPKTHNLREVAATYPASETSIPFGRITKPEQGYHGCRPWEGTLTLYYSIAGAPWRIWTRNRATATAADSTFVGEDVPEEVAEPTTEPGTTGEENRAVLTRFALGTS